MRTSPASAWDRIAATIEEAAVNAWRHRPFTLAAVVAIALTLTFPALVVLALGWAVRFTHDVAAEERVRVFLDEACTPAQAEAVRQALAAAPGVARVERVTSVEARERFLARFPELEDVVASLDPEELSFPESIEAASSGDQASLATAAARVRGLGGVEDVRHDASWARRLHGVQVGLRAARVVVALAALAVTAFAIGNVVRMGALARREHLAIMRLVGAPWFHLRAPFVIEGLVQGVLGGMAAAALVGLAARWSLPHVRQVFPHAMGLDSGGIAVLVVAPGIAGMLGAALALESVLRHHARLER